MYTFKSRWIICSLCMYATPSKICFINAIQAFSVSTNSSSITRSKSSPPPMLHKMNEEIWTVYSSIANKKNALEFIISMSSLRPTYYSMINVISFLPLSYASNSRRSFGFFKAFMISISLSTFLLSSRLVQRTNFAANSSPVSQSLHFNTRPNLPLKVDDV